MNVKNFDVITQLYDKGRYTEKESPFAIYNAMSQYLDCNKIEDVKECIAFICDLQVLDKYLFEISKGGKI